MPQMLGTKIRHRVIRFAPDDVKTPCPRGSDHTRSSALPDELGVAT